MTYHAGGNIDFAPLYMIPIEDKDVIFDALEREHEVTYLACIVNKTVRVYQTYSMPFLIIEPNETSTMLSD